MSYTLSVKMREDFREEIEKGIKITGATSVSDFLRDAVREYLAELGLLSERAKRIREGER